MIFAIFGEFAILKRRFTFRQNHSSGFIQRRLDYFFISNSLQEMTKYTDILAAFSTDHALILITLSKINKLDRGKGFWKFNNSLKKNEDYVETIKNVIKSTLRSLDEQGVNNPQARWEFLKYEIQKNSIQFSKTLSKIKNRELENKFKVFEANSILQCDNEYLDCKERLDNLYQEQINGIHIGSRCDWYKYGEKSSKFFLNLEKSHTIQGQIRYLLSGNYKLTNKKEINTHLCMFYKSQKHKSLTF